jgi:uncharacterized protein YdeI (YjbR/CyaY-like superfamily)
MSQSNDLPVRLFKTVAAWDKWLSGHAGEKGLWLKFAKKGQGVVSVTYAEALDVALCHGWIDSQLKTLDAPYYLQKFTPRKAKSLWSKINVEKAEKLVAAERMQSGGLREVEAAKADGRWQAAYDSSSSMPVPEELAMALAKDKKAKAFFETLDRTNRYAVCWRVQTAKKPETRASRVEKLVAMLAKGEKIH